MSRRDFIAELLDVNKRLRKELQESRKLAEEARIAKVRLEEELSASEKKIKALEDRIAELVSRVKELEEKLKTERRTPAEGPFTPRKEQGNLLELIKRARELEKQIEAMP